jgi:hypothetical protein
MRVSLAVLIVLGGCDGAARLAEDSRGTFTFELATPCERTHDAEGDLWLASDSTVRITAQRIPLHDQVLRQRDVQSVADAIATMHELGEPAGTLSPIACRLAVEEPACLSGFVEHEETSYSKRLAVFRVGDEIVVVGLLAPAQDSDRATEQWQLLTRTLRVEG